MQRAIHILPDTSEFPLIEKLRQRFDWLHPHLPAHITLVFPFELGGVLNTDLIQRCAVVAGEFQTFTISLRPPELSEDNHCWLPVEPHESLCALATRLHGGPLAALASARQAFKPHITLGRPPLGSDVLPEIISAWPATPVSLVVESFMLEEIHPDHSSKMLGRFSLRPPAGKR